MNQIEILREMGLTPVWANRDGVSQYAEPIAAEPVAPDARAAEAQPAAAPVAKTASSSEPPVPSSETEEPAQNEIPAMPVYQMDWDALERTVASCANCGLCQKRHKTVFGVGDRHARWLFVGEGPGENEDRQGEPFVGQAGKLLDLILEALHMKRGENVYIANVVKCRPPGNRAPTPIEADSCRPYLERQIELIQPKVIVALGKSAAALLLNTEASIASMRGKKHHYREVPLVVTYHPAYLLRTPQDKGKVWEDLLFAKRILAEASD